MYLKTPKTAAPRIATLNPGRARALTPDAPRAPQSPAARARAALKRLAPLALALATLGALGACNKGAKACPDVVVSESCTLRCARKALEGGATKICGKSLMVQSGGTNEILQRDTKRIEFRQLTDETCFEVDATGALARAEDKKTLQDRCEAH